MEGPAMPGQPVERLSGHGWRREGLGAGGEARVNAGTVARVAAGVDRPAPLPARRRRPAPRRDRTLPCSGCGRRCRSRRRGCRCAFPSRSTSVVRPCGVLPRRWAPRTCSSRFLERRKVIK